MENVTRKTRPASGKWILAVAMTLLFQLTAVAQDFPSDFGDGDNPIDETPATPIVDYVWVLVAIGIGFAFYKYKTNGKQTHSKR
jgi:hypothetical protein